MTDAPLQQDTARSKQVTAAGILLLILALLYAAGVVAMVVQLLSPLIQASGFVPAVLSPDAFPIWLLLVISALFFVAGLAAIQRWSRWRIWAGTVAWLMIAVSLLYAITAFALFGPIIFIAIAAFILRATRLERPHRTDKAG